MPIPAARAVPEPARLRFGIFELDAQSGDLRREGAVVHLPPQPFKVLWLLARRAGEVVTREEIREELWGNDTFVDFDGGLNFCINQIRRALRDNAESPRFVHTLPRRGYRFIAPVEPVRAAALASPSAPVPAAEPGEREAARVLEMGTGRALPAPETSRTRARRRLPSPALLAIVAATVTVLLAAVALQGRRPAAADPTYERITFRRGTVTAARFASGGEVVYSAAWEGRPSALFTARPARYDAQPVGVSPAALAGVLPSGDLAAILYRDARPNVLVRATSGSAPREIRETLRDADWSREDEAVIAYRKGASDHLEFPLGHDVYATPSMISDPRVSPDGARVAFLEHPTPGDDRGDVVMVDRAGRRAVLTAGWASIEGLAWSPDGSEVWFTGARVGDDSPLNAVDMAGRVRVLLRGPGRLVLRDAAPDGRVLLERSVRSLDARVRLPGSDAEHDLSWHTVSLVTGIAADGSAIVINVSGQGGSPGYDVFYRRTDGATPVRLGEGRAMGVSPDGRWVLAIPLSDPPRILTLPTGAGVVRVLGAGLTGHASAGWFPDSRRVAFVAAERGHGPRVFVQDLAAGPPRAVTAEGVSAWRPVVSNDGSRMVVRTSGPEGAWLDVPLDGGPPAPLAGLDAGRDRVMTWTADGRALLVQRATRDAAAIDRVEYPSGERRLVTAVEPVDRTGLTHMGGVVMTPDGRALAYSVETVFSELYIVTGVR